MTTLNPYLNFDGSTEQAMRFYAEALNATLDIMRFEGSPVPVPKEHAQRVMHATLKTATLTLMASDTMPGQATTRGNQVHLSLNFQTKEEQQRVWDKLSEGAEVTMPLAEVFFGRFGALTDKFGIGWMLHLDASLLES
jgi:PhnB protein